jgi:hypothetical protein
MIVGTGQFKYRVNADWAKLPEGWSYKEVGGVGVDSRDNVYVFQSRRAPDDGLRPRRQLLATARR